MGEARSGQSEVESGSLPPPKDHALSSFLGKAQGPGRTIPLLEAGVAQRVADHWEMRWGTTSTHSTQHFFDLASITKSHFATAVARLVETDRLSWDVPLRDLLPEVSGTHGGEQTVEALLSHRSGLAAHVELFRDSWEGAPIHIESCLLRAARAKAASGGIHRAPIYSDLGYILVGFGVRRLLNCELDHALQEHLMVPWNLGSGSVRTLRKRSSEFLHWVAPTEIQAARGGQLCGQVHDDNAWALAGTGMCGHAGLFGTLQDVLSFGAKLLDARAGRTTEAERRMLAALVQRRPGGTLKMGFDGVKGGNSMAGKEASPETFGHLGFTGTSFWCDPDRERVTALLTNRVHPTRDNPSIRVVRPKIHDFLWTC